MQIKNLLAVLTFSTLVFLGTNTQAQISVETDGRIFMGYGLPSFNTVATISTDPTGTNTTTLELNNTYTGSGLKYGLINYMTGGSGKKYGIYSLTTQTSPSSSETYGLYTRTEPSGVAKGYGIYNTTHQNGGTGANYGIYNKTTRSAGGASYGMYNQTDGEGNNTTYGIYNKVNHDFKGNNRQFGVYNYVTKTDQGSVTTLQNTTSLSNTTGYSYGIKNYIGGSSSGNTFGIHSSISGNHMGNVYGVYSSVATSLGYTGYFSGNVYVTGTITQTSDESTKRDITNLNNALALVKQLDGKTYYFKDSKTINLPEEKQYGFLAQDLEKVLPDLVKEVENPDPSDSNATTEQQTTTLKSVNYTALIPILVEAIKEQQQEIEELKALIQKK